ncbi:hypothetical protein CgunFtcFv8_010139 [Champsocephalus gunnari]|uniref:Uncharacterized protein n=1 Tax=Champsocephalus gunnari TaxID=52237 RepID=A0AAN8DVC6_CHAGU|nr:hypothetical protein CgunFtcFv8_010139 [Champsocephalus gunnari]
MDASGLQRRGSFPSVLTQQTQEGCFRTPEERILSICADSADSGRMLQDSRGEDPFHLTQQTQEGCFRTPEERILSICADSADSGRMLQDSRGGSFPSDSADSGRMLQDSSGEDPFHLC